MNIDYGWSSEQEEKEEQQEEREFTGPPNSKKRRKTEKNGSTNQRDILGSPGKKRPNLSEEEENQKRKKANPQKPEIYPEPNSTLSDGEGFQGEGDSRSEDEGSNNYVNIRGKLNVWCVVLCHVSLDTHVFYAQRNAFIRDCIGWLVGWLVG